MTLKQLAERVTLRLSLTKGSARLAKVGVQIFEILYGNKSVHGWYAKRKIVKTSTAWHTSAFVYPVGC